MGLAQKAGLTPEPAERLQYHVHAHLDVFVNGTRVPVPAGIGIDTKNPSVASFDLDGGQVGWGLKTECASPCISPLHTHDPSGIIHTESATPTPNVLGQFFTQWDVALDANCVGGYCKPADSDRLLHRRQGVAAAIPTAIELADGREIAIVIGTPPADHPVHLRPVRRLTMADTSAADERLAGVITRLDIALVLHAAGIDARSFSHASSTRSPAR